MKKFLSVFIVCIFMVGTMFTLTGCGNNKTPSVQPSSNPNTSANPSDNNPNTPAQPVTSNLKTEKALAPLTTEHYYMKMIADVENEQGDIIKNATMEITVDGKNFATDIKSAGYGMIVKDDTMYYIIHEAKQYTAMGVQENTNQEMLSEFGDEEYINDFIESGTKDFNGKNYYYEKFGFEGDNSTLYFEGDNIKYVETEYKDGTPTTTMEIVEISDKTKSSLLDIPAGYTEMSF